MFLSLRGWRIIRRLADTPPADRQLEVIVEKYRRVLRAAIDRVCPRSLGLEVADIEQDACIRLWHALRAERNITNAASYLYRIGVSATIDAIRRVKARREDPLNEPDDDEERKPPHLVSGARSPERVASDGQLADAIERALGELDDQRQRAVRLHLQGFTTTEIAGLLDWTEPKARNLVSRGMVDLREGLRRMGIEEAHD